MPFSRIFTRVSRTELIETETFGSTPFFSLGSLSLLRDERWLWLDWWELFSIRPPFSVNWDALKIKWENSSFLVEQGERRLGAKWDFLPLNFVKCTGVTNFPISPCFEQCRWPIFPTKAYVQPKLWDSFAEILSHGVRSSSIPTSNFFAVAMLTKCDCLFAIDLVRNAGRNVPVLLALMQISEMNRIGPGHCHALVIHKRECCVVATSCWWSLRFAWMARGLNSRKDSSCLLCT